MPESVLFPFVVALWAAPLAGPAISSIRSTARHAARHRHHPPPCQTRGLPSIHEGKFPSHIATNPRVCALWTAIFGLRSLDCDLWTAPLDIRRPPGLPPAAPAPPTRHAHRHHTPGTPHQHHPPTRQTRGLPSIHEGKYPSHITTNPRVCALWAAPLAPHTFDQSLDQT